MKLRRFGIGAIGLLLAGQLLAGGGSVLGQQAFATPTSPAASISPASSPSAIGPSSTDPLATVNALLDIVIGRRFDQVASYACPASAASLDQHLDFAAGIAPSLPAGMDVQGLIDAMTLSIPDRSLSLVSSQGTTAIVDFRGTLTIAVDQEVLRPWVKALLVASGQDSSDASVDASIPTIANSFGPAQDISRQIQLTDTNGLWLICDPSLTPTPTD
jgi:hypothetical protein